MSMGRILGMAPVIPVLRVDRAEDAVPMARALVQGGLRVLEITLRTPAAWAAIAAVCREVPEAVVGAGTVTRPAELDRARGEGAAFAVSPGATPALLDAARRARLPCLPGVMTPSEVMAARELGFTDLKLFPAAQAGGTALLKALAGPFPDVRFCPTGGITRQSYREYLALENVACVGGSWLAPDEAVAAGDWARIAELALETAAEDGGTSAQRRQRALEIEQWVVEAATATWSVAGEEDPGAATEDLVSRNAASQGPDGDGSS